MANSGRMSSELMEADRSTRPLCYAEGLSMPRKLYVVAAHSSETVRALRAVVRLARQSAGRAFRAAAVKSQRQAAWFASTGRHETADASVQTASRCRCIRAG